MQEKRIEGNFNQGWGVALFVVILAIVINVVATRIHFSGYKPGNDVGSQMGDASRADNAPMGH
ncbi:MAG: hypothetical protein ACJ79S_15040 [Gemmatimonadaceae bacterium]